MTAASIIESNATSLAGTFDASGAAASAQAASDPVGTAAALLTNAAATVLPTLGATPQWVRMTGVVPILYSALSAAAKTATAALSLQLAVGTFVHATALKINAAFAGGGETASTISVGDTTSVTRFLAAQNTFTATFVSPIGIPQAVSNVAMQAVTETTLEVQLTTTTNNTSALTGGSVDVWMLLSKPY